MEQHGKTEANRATLSCNFNPAENDLFTLSAQLDKSWMFANILTWICHIQAIRMAMNSVRNQREEIDHSFNDKRQRKMKETEQSRAKQQQQK